VLAAAALGLTVQPPLAWLAGHHGLDVVLAVLVLATALTIEPGALRGLGARWRRLLAALAAGITVLPALSWAASRLVAPGPLRDGVMVTGLAPSEIACVATTVMAGGAAAVAAGLLIGSAAVTVAAAGPILALEAGHGAVRPAGIVTGLALVVAVPLAAGIWLRARVPLIASAERAATATATAAVAALVALTAAEVHLRARYLAVALALAVFLAGTVLAGRLLGIGLPRQPATALLLAASMRDFAVAAALAAAAFGPPAAAPLGLYGILALAWGTGAAGVLRARQAAGPAVPGAAPSPPGGRR